MYHRQYLFQNYDQRCINPECQVVMAIKFCTKVPKISGSSLWNWLRVALLAPRILRWLQVFCKNLPTPAYETVWYDGLYSDVAEHLYLLGCNAVSGPRLFQGTWVYFLHLRCWSSKRRLEFSTVWPLNTETLCSFETSRTIRPKTNRHIWQDLNTHIWDALSDECEGCTFCHMIELMWVGLRIRPLFITLCEKLSAFRGLGRSLWDATRLWLWKFLYHYKPYSLMRKLACSNCSCFGLW